jgi:hypothetical protein
MKIIEWGRGTIYNTSIPSYTLIHSICIFVLLTCNYLRVNPVHETPGHHTDPCTLRRLVRPRLSRQLRTPPTVAHPPQPPAPHAASCCAPASAASSARRQLLRTRVSRQLRTPPTVAHPPQPPAPHAANCCAPASAASLALRHLLRCCLSRQLNH